MMYNLYINNPCNFVVIKTIIDEEKITFLLHQLKFILVKISFSRSVFYCASYIFTNHYVINDSMILTAIELSFVEFKSKDQLHFNLLLHILSI